MSEADKPTTEHLFAEKHRIERKSQIRELILGAQDGLLVPLGVVTSVAGAFNNNHIVIVAGISEALAGAFSMATGTYLASQAEKQVHDAEIEKEKNAIDLYPENEVREMEMLFEREGMHAEDAKSVVNILAKHKNSFAVSMIQKELGLDPDPVSTPFRDGINVGLSYLFAAAVPLLPYFFVTGTTAILFSMVSTMVALFIIGYMKGRLAFINYIKSGLEVMFIGMVSGLGGYLLGTWLPKLLHLE